MIILGIETSCDETAAAVIKIDKKRDSLKLLANVISSQIKLHAKWGGVVPNLAAREHLKNILPVIKASLAEAKVSPKNIDFLAVTNGPGLIPALLVGTNTAKTLSYCWQKPLLGIHHIEGHIYANFIGQKHNAIKFPILCLVVSGGHTQLILMKKHLDYKIIGETQDDAAGEAFDKTARILGLGYPGGPAVAEAAKFSKKVQIINYKLPRPMIYSNNFNFSFSGLKTAVLYAVKKDPAILKNKKAVSALCAEFQQAVIDVLVSKTVRAAQKYRPQTILLAGGVSANQELQKQLAKAIKETLKNVSFSFPKTSYQLDNAAMVAAAAYFRLRKSGRQKQLLASWKNMRTEANLKLL